MMDSEELELLTEALRDAYRQGAEMRRFVDAGLVSEDVAVAAMCAVPSRRGEFKVVRPAGSEDGRRPKAQVAAGLRGCH